jgi:hypothetical protein
MRNLGRHMNDHLIDPTIAFLTSNDLTKTFFARTFLIEAIVPFSMTRLRNALSARDIDSATKKRGSGVDSDELIHRLRLHGSREETLIRHA